MKIIGILVIALFLSCNFSFAQDTLYIYKSGIVITKHAVADIDSVTFKKNYNTNEPETVTDQVGNMYHAIKIGTQTWMVENLKTTKYRNGDIIQNLSSTSDWSYATTGAWCEYNNLSANGTKYGKLYNWYAVSDTRMLAPIGWHVASDAEWTVLTTFLGGIDVAGGKLKEAGTTNWVSQNVGATNESKFTALPGGARGNADGTFMDIGTGSYWWTSTLLDYTYSWVRSMGTFSQGIGRTGSPKPNGLYVRCVKDVLPVVTTAMIGSIQTNTVVAGGNVTDDGGTPVTSRGICWSNTPNPTIANNKTTDGSGIGIYTSSITGLIGDSTYYVRAYATNNVGTSYGAQVSFKTLQSQLQTVTDIDGNVYHAVIIGTQTWMVENLKTTKYRNGDIIQNLPSTSDWSYATTGAWCEYNNLSANGTKYGKLYNWYAVSDTRILAPVGWHVASDSEWTVLTNFLGGTDVAGGKLKEAGTTNWVNQNVGATNETKFTALPGGSRSYTDGTFFDIGRGSYWWTSTILDYTYTWVRSMGSFSQGIGRTGSPKPNGLYVRCVKDASPVITTVAPN